MINTQYRKPLPGTQLDYFDAREAVNAIAPGAWDRLSYTARVHAENLVRKCDPAILDECLGQIVFGQRERDFPGSRHGWCATTSWGRPPWWTSLAFATPSPIRGRSRPGEPGRAGAAHRRPFPGR